MTPSSSIASRLILLAATAAALFVSPAQAHGRILVPRVVFSGPYPDSPVDQIDGYKALPPPSGQSYSGTPETNTRAFTQAFQQSSYGSLRALALANQGPRVRTCGDTTTDGVAQQPLPAAVEFGFRAGEGFVPDHQGPCEVWCGNATRVFHDDNCAKTFRDGPAKLPYDRAACDASGARVLTFYWLALHLPKWQLYINCAAIATSGRAGGNNATTTTPTAAPKPATTAAPPQTTTTAPKTTAAPPKTTTTAPKTTAAPPKTTSAPGKTAAPATTTAAPDQWAGESDAGKTNPPTSAPVATKKSTCRVHK